MFTVERKIVRGLKSKSKARKAGQSFQFNLLRVDTNPSSLSMASSARTTQKIDDPKTREALVDA